MVGTQLILFSQMNELMAVSFYLLYVMFPLPSNIALNFTIINVMEFITDSSCSTHGIDTVLMPVLLIKELRLRNTKGLSSGCTVSEICLPMLSSLQFSF